MDAVMKTQCVELHDMLSETLSLLEENINLAHDNLTLLTRLHFQPVSPALIVLNQYFSKIRNIIVTINDATVNKAKITETDLNQLAELMKSLVGLYDTAEKTSPFRDLYVPVITTGVILIRALKFGSNTEDILILCSSMTCKVSKLVSQVIDSIALLLSSFHSKSKK